MKKLMILPAVLLALLVGCGSSSDSAGPDGWKDAPDFENIMTENKKGDSLLVARMELFGKELFVHTLLLKDTDLKGSCEASDKGENEDNLTAFESSVQFAFPENSNIEDFSVDINLLIGVDPDTQEELTAGLFLFKQSLPSNAVEDFSTSDRVKVVITDNCGESNLERSFNTTGNLVEMLRTLDQRKSESVANEVEGEFQ